MRLWKTIKRAGRKIAATAAIAATIANAGYVPNWRQQGAAGGEKNMVHMREMNKSQAELEIDERIRKMGLDKRMREFEKKGWRQGHKPENYTEEIMRINSVLNNQEMGPEARYRVLSVNFKVPADRLLSARLTGCSNTPSA
ncbi:MAG: hypothetical protein V1676_05125 [Candidatus Diapherotrites archaeon]